MTLATDLRAAGLTVVEYDGWLTRGSGWFDGKPTGVMHHHTALPVPFPPARLVGDRLKANVNTKPDGTVILLAKGACNFSSGPGSSVVLTEVRQGVSPTANAKTRGLEDNMNGNPFFFNFENDHEGRGGPIPQVQLDAIVTATRVVLDHYDLTAGNVISHAEWTARKSDPFWNGDRRCIETIRTSLTAVPPAEPLEEDMPLTQADVELIWRYGHKTNPDGSELSPSAYQYLIRTKANTDYLIGQVKDLSDDELAELQAIADAVNDEIDRRARARLGVS